MTTPKPPVVLDLDTLDAEGKSTTTTDVVPYVFKVAGKPFTVADLAGLDWQDLTELGADVKSDLRLMLGEEQFEAFYAIRGIPPWKLEQLVRSFIAHYGLGGLPEGDASPSS